MDDLIGKVISFVNELYGSYMKIQEIHWNTYKKGVHTTQDEIKDALIDYADKLGEVTIGIDSRPGFDVLHPIIPMSTSSEEICTVLTRKAERLKESSIGPGYSGLVNVLDDFCADFNKYTYLSTLL